MFLQHYFTVVNLVHSLPLVDGLYIRILYDILMKSLAVYVIMFSRMYSTYLYTNLSRKILTQTNAKTLVFCCYKSLLLRACEVVYMH